MNESVGQELSEFLNDDLATPHDDNLGAAAIDDDDIDIDADVDAEAESDTVRNEAPAARTTREGLPANFRMRHDAHYVEELMSRPIEGTTSTFDRRARRQTEPEPPKPAFPAAPGLAAKAAAAGADQALALLADRLESLVAHAAAQRQPHAGAALSRTIQLEFAKAARLARAGAILQKAIEPAPRPLFARDIADAVTVASTPIVRLSGMECEVTVDDPSFAIAAEAPLAVQAIAGTIDALVDLLLADTTREPALDARHPAPRIAVNLQCVTVRPAIIVDVICSALFLSARQAERFFDSDAEQYGRVPSAGLLLAAAARVVRAHGGRADVRRHTGVGVTVTYVFPREGADASL